MLNDQTLITASMTEIRTYSTRDCVRVKFPTRAKMIKFPRKFKLPFDSDDEGDETRDTRLSRLVDPQSSIPEGRVTRYGETNTATLTGNEITVLFAISYRLLHAG